MTAWPVANEVGWKHNMLISLYTKNANIFNNILEWRGESSYFILGKLRIKDMWQWKHSSFFGSEHNSY